MIPLVILAGGLVASTGIRLYKTLKKYDELTPDDIITSAENESTNLPTTELAIVGQRM